MEIAGCEIAAAQIPGAAVFGETEELRAVQQAGQPWRVRGKFGGPGERGMAGSGGAAEIGAAQRIKFRTRPTAEGKLRGGTQPGDPFVGQEAVVACLQAGF